MPPKRETDTARNGLPYVPPRLVEGARWYVEYWQWSHHEEKLVRRRFFKIVGRTVKEKRRSAQAHMKEIARLLDDGYAVDNPRALPAVDRDHLALEDAIKMAREVKISETGQRSKEHYISQVNIFLAWCEENRLARLPVQSFSKNHVLDFLEHLTQVRGVGARTRNNYREKVGACFAVLLDRGLVATNPVSKTRVLPTRGARHVPFTPSEQQTLEAYLKREMPDLFTFTRFIYYGFMRPIEILKLKVKHISLENRIILVRAENTKNKQQMPVVITRQMIPIIEGLGLAELPPEWYVFSYKLRPGRALWSRNRVSEMHRRALEETGLHNGELDLYGWKHTGVCAAYRAGVDIQAIMQQCRHHSLSQTEIYLRSLGLRISKELKDKEW